MQIARPHSGFLSNDHDELRRYARMLPEDLELTAGMNRRAPVVGPIPDEQAVFSGYDYTRIFMELSVI